jgi:AcrR family transcriptional regulator
MVLSGVCAVGQRYGSTARCAEPVSEPTLSLLRPNTRRFRIHPHTLRLPSLAVRQEIWVPTILKGKEQYFQCAVRILADEGYESLIIGRLVGALGVTSGSFYHHFGSWDGFVEALLDFEENRQVDILRRQNFGTGGAEADIATLRNLTVSLNHRAEAALRAWSLNSAIVRAGMGRIDARRYKTVHNVVRAIVGDTKKAKVLTDMGTAMLIGYQQMVVTGDVTSAELLFDEYVHVVFSYQRRQRTKR